MNNDPNIGVTDTGNCDYLVTEYFSIQSPSGGTFSGGGGRGGGGRGGGGSKILSEDEQIQQAIYESLKAEEEKMRKIIESFKNF